MLVEERRQHVLDLIGRQGFATLGDLARTLGVSESTLRRDLAFWEERGQLRKIHGGAMFTGDAALPALEERSGKQIEEKRAIAKVAAERIRDGDVILIDGGTTTIELARMLVGRPLQVVTNSLPIAQLFSGSQQTDLVMLGGYVYPKTGVALGPMLIRQLEDVHVQQMLLSVSGITAKGLFNSNMLLVEAERRMMRCADEVVVLADHTKFGRQALAHLCDLGAIDSVVTDSATGAEHRRMVDDAGARVHVATVEPNARPPVVYDELAREPETDEGSLHDQRNN
jgi:DeoR family transcriptional regulator, fructose operon transcriptional repressor